MASQNHSSTESWPSEHHIAPVSSYFKVFGALMGLTILTVATAKGLHLNPHVLNIILAMVIAIVKASLVVMFFMHQKYETKMNKAIFIAGFIALALLIFFCALDLVSRKSLTNDPAVMEKLIKKQAEVLGEH